MGKQWKQWETLFSWAPKSLQMVTAAMKLKMIAPWKKSYEQPRQHIKKQRHYFAKTGVSGQSYGFSSNHVQMRELDYKESWAPKNWCFELWCWRRLLRVPWTARRSNQSIPKEISPEYSLEGLMLKLKLQYFRHLMWRKRTHWKTPWCWERLKAGGEGDCREWDGWIALLTQWKWVWISSGSWWWTGKPGMLQSMRSNELDMTEQLNLTDILIYCIKSIILLLVFCLFHLCYVPFSLFSCLHWDNFSLVILLCLIFYSI